jgi:hypothetical protein
VRHHLLSSPFNILFTLLGIAVLAMIIPPFVRWAVIDADFVGSSRADCTGNGACWIFVREKLRMFIYGFYPAAELWRANLTIALGTGTIVLLQFGKSRKAKITALALLPIVAMFLLSGGVFGLEHVETGKWGGLLLTTTLLFGSFAMAAVPAGIGVFQVVCEMVLPPLYRVSKVQAVTLALLIHTMLLFPMATVGTTVIASNGSHTDPIAEKIAAGMTPRDALVLALMTMDYEKDDYNTPRIAGVVEPDEGYRVEQPAARAKRGDAHHLKRQGIRELHGQEDGRLCRLVL